jgi:hypothetical protein
MNSSRLGGLELGGRYHILLLLRSKFLMMAFQQQYEREGKWVYEQHPFWCTGYTFWELHSEAPDLFLHLSRSDLVYFKGDLNHRKLTYDCAAPASTPFDIAIGPMASSAGAPKVCSLRTIKSDVVVGLGTEGDEIAEELDKDEPGWKISGKYVCIFLCLMLLAGALISDLLRPWCYSLMDAPGRKCDLLESRLYEFVSLFRSGESGLL